MSSSRNIHVRVSVTACAVTQMISMGIRSSLIQIINEFLDSRKMTVKFNQEKSILYELIGDLSKGPGQGKIVI